MSVFGLFTYPYLSALFSKSKSPEVFQNVETGQRLGSTERHMSHQRQHHICLDMGRMITCYMCITLMAEP